MLSKVTLDKTDLKVSQLCYGTNMLGTAVDQAQANKILDRFVELGGNFLDTARSYGDWVSDAPCGASEGAIGAWLKERDRKNIVIATKGGFFDLRKRDWRNRVTPKDITSDLEQSLNQLGVDTIDLYWLHADNPQAPVDPLIDMLIGHQKAGRIGHFGASNWSGQRITEAQAYAKSIGHRGFVAVQPFWGLAAPNTEGAAAVGYGLYYEDGLRSMHEAGLTVVPYSGQSRGFFSKLALGEEGLRDDLKAMYLNDGNRARMKIVQRLAVKHDASINDIVLAYLICQPHQTIPIIGAGHPEQIEDSVKAVGVKLSAQELAELRAG